MESTWAGDYVDSDYERYWKEPERKPYLIHWAGEKMSPEHSVSDLFYQYLSPEEKEAFLKSLRGSHRSRWNGLLQRFRNASFPSGK